MTPIPANPTGPCLCGLEGPDENGQYDLLEHPECPLHGEAKEEDDNG